MKAGIVKLLFVTLLIVIIVGCTNKNKPQDEQQVFVEKGDEIVENIQENDIYIERSNYFSENPLTEGQVVFFGNSLTEGGKWDVYFPNSNTANRGISGDNTEGMLARLDEVVDSKPSKVFIMAGTNDISLNRPNDRIIANVTLLLERLQAETPTTKIYLQSVLPICNSRLKYERMRGKEDKIEALNKDLEKLAEKLNITFINVYSHLLSDEQSLNPNFTGDGLHLNEEAYQAWVEQLKIFIEE